MKLPGGSRAFCPTDGSGRPGQIRTPSRARTGAPVSWHERKSMWVAARRKAVYPNTVASG